jgi:hypothetical protein
MVTQAEILSKTRIEIKKSWLDLIDDNDWVKLSRRDREFLLSIQNECMDERYFEEIKE